MAEIESVPCKLRHGAAYVRSDNEWKIVSRIYQFARFTSLYIRVPILLRHDSTTSTSEQNDILDLVSSYPVCNVTSHVHDHSTATTFTRPVLHDNSALSPTSLTSPAAPYLSAPSHIDESQSHDRVTS